MGISQSVEPVVELIATTNWTESRPERHLKKGYPYIRFLYKNHKWEEKDVLYIGQLIGAREIKVSQDDKYLLIISNVLYLIDLRKPLEQRRQRILSDDFHECAFSPNSRLLLAYSNFKYRLSVFDLDTGKEHLIARAGAYKAGWYPDSRRIWYYRKYLHHPDGIKWGAVYEYDLLTRRRRVLATEVMAKRWELLNPNFCTDYAYFRFTNYRRLAYSRSGDIRLVLDSNLKESPWVEWRDGQKRKVIWNADIYEWANPLDISDDGEWALLNVWVKREHIATEAETAQRKKFYPAFVLINTRTGEERILLGFLEQGKPYQWVDNSPDSPEFRGVVRLRFVYPQGARR